jgi:signal transduction histidine kinase
MMLADAHGEALRLARLVDELLLLARADASSDGTAAGGTAGEMADGAQGAAQARETSRTPVIELDRVVLQLVRQLRGRLSADASRLRLAIGHIEPARVRGDEETVRRIALILLDNAMKYTLAKGDDATTGRITVRVEHVDSEVVLRVQDTGIGVAAADLPHIFERFYRADTARKREGTGLGLAIAQTLVERLGGRISVESAPGAGSTFSVWLPSADVAVSTSGK